MRVHLDWQVQGSSTWDLNDALLRRAVADGVDLWDDESLEHWLRARLMEANGALLQAVVDEWDEKDQPEIINGVMAEGDPPAWFGGPDG